MIKEKLIMNFFSILTHSLALAAGWMLLSLANHGDSGTPSVQEPGRLTDRTSSHFKSRPTPKRLLNALTHTAMDPNLRKGIKNRIYRDWAGSDPVGLLNYLDGRAWHGCGNDAFANLAQSQPEYLLDYARQHGCLEALHTLSSRGAPYVVLNLYLAQKPGSIPASEFNTLFANGLRSDPQFHLNIDRIDDPERRTEAFTATAKIWLELELHDIYFARLKELHESLQLDTIIHDFGYHILSNREDVTLLDLLPENTRDRALKEVIEWMPQISHRSQSYQRASLTAYLENGWLEGHIDRAKYIILAQVDSKEPDNSHLADAVEWRNWGLALPDGDKWQPLRHAAIRRWIVADPSQWKAIVRLPSLALRDIAYTAVLSAIDLEKEAHAIPWIVDQVKDPAFKGIALRVISERQNADADDPFGSSDEIDPFDPFADNQPVSDPFSDTP